MYAYLVIYASRKNYSFSFLTMVISYVKFSVNPQIFEYSLGIDVSFLQGAFNVYMVIVLNYLNPQR